MQLARVRDSESRETTPLLLTLPFRLRYLRYLSLPIIYPTTNFFHTKCKYLGTYVLTREVLGWCAFA